MVVVNQVLSKVLLNNIFDENNSLWELLVKAVANWNPQKFNLQGCGRRGRGCNQGIVGGIKKSKEQDITQKPDGSKA